MTEALPDFIKQEIWDKLSTDFQLFTKAIDDAEESKTVADFTKAQRIFDQVAEYAKKTGFKLSDRWNDEKNRLDNLMRVVKN